MVMIPGTRSAGSSEEKFETGGLVLYEHEGAPVLACITGYQKNKYSLLNMRARRADMNSNRLHLLPGKVPSGYSTESEQAGYLLELFEKATADGSELSLSEIWTLVQGEKEEFTTSELTQLYFGNDSLEHHLALRIALSDDRIYFKRRRGIVTPRPAETIEELIKAEEAKAEKERLFSQTLDFFETLAKQKRSSNQPEVPDSLIDVIDLLKRIAAASPHIDNSQSKDAIEILKGAEERLRLNKAQRKEDRAYNLLRSIGIFHKNTNLSFIRHDIQVDFPDEVCQEASTLKAPSSYDDLPESERAYRSDLTSLAAVTIDDAATMDMDDALTLEQTSNGFRLGIHISDVAAAIQPGSLLDKDAHRRATSIYCPEQNFHMLPQQLSEDTLSLVEGECRRAFSCIVEVDHEYRIQSKSLCHSLIRVAKKYSYDEVEKILLDDQIGDLHHIYNIANTFQGKRLSEGALQIPKRIVYISLTNPTDLKNSDFILDDVDENGPSRSLIGEMMIMMNSAIADYCNEKNIPLIYRSQEGPEPSEMRDPRSVPAGPAQDYVMRSNLRRSAVTTSAAPHATLGLQAYAQLTSPIRRYLDLVNQRQISAAIKGEEIPCSAEQLEELISSTQEPLKRGMQVTRETRKFWLQKYLQKKQKRQEHIQGTVLRTDMKNPMVELEEIYIPVLIQKSQGLQPGDELLLEISSVDPRRDYLKLGVVKKLN